MILPVKITSNKGASKDNLDYGQFRKWLTPIWARATIHPDENKPPVQVGTALAFIIRRSAIQLTFHEEMEVPHSGTKNLALGLFDRYGRLKEEISQHPLRRGSGVWKKELDDGNLVLIEEVEVERNYRRKGIGLNLVLHILEQAMMPQYNVSYAFACAAAHDDDDYGAGNAEPANLPHCAKVEAVVSFLRSVRFRRVGITSWFALARDKGHPSWRLARNEDVDPKPQVADMIDSDSDEEMILCNPDFTQTRVSKDEWEARWLGKTPKQKPAITSRKRPLHYAVKTLPDQKALTFLKSHTRDGVPGTLSLETVDGRGDTVLHVAAQVSKPACVEWLLRQPAKAQLIKTRNYAGYTPLETLQSELENRRVQAPHGFQRAQLLADKFDGFDEDSVICLLLLQGINEPSVEQRMRAKFGCSCGKCLNGFLSSRMLMKLRDQAQLQRDFLASLVPPGDVSWYAEFKDLLQRLPESLRNRIRRSKPIQRAFVLLVGAVAECLSRGKIPHKATVLAHLEATGAREHVESQYFALGGTVAAITGAIFDNTKLHDIEVGEAIIDATLEEYYNGTPSCRNDLEFEFARRHCVDDDIPDKEKDKPLP